LIAPTSSQLLVQLQVEDQVEL